MTPQPKYNYYRNPKILAAANGEPCTCCGRNDGTTVAAHSNGLGSGKGVGIKADDCFTSFLCSLCHFRYDNKTEEPASGELYIDQYQFETAMCRTWKRLLEKGTLK